VITRQDSFLAADFLATADLAVANPHVANLEELFEIREQHRF
jgi:hypothetical protein